MIIIQVCNWASLLLFLMDLTCTISHAEPDTQSIASSSPPMTQFDCGKKSWGDKFWGEDAIRSGGPL